MQTVPSTGSSSGSSTRGRTQAAATRDPPMCESLHGPVVSIETHAFQLVHTVFGHGLTTDWERPEDREHPAHRRHRGHRSVCREANISVSGQPPSAALRA